MKLISWSLCDKFFLRCHFYIHKNCRFQSQKTRVPGISSAHHNLAALLFSLCQEQGRAKRVIFSHLSRLKSWGLKITMTGFYQPKRHLSLECPSLIFSLSFFFFSKISQCEVKLPLGPFLGSQNLLRMGQPVLRNY